MKNFIIKKQGQGSYKIEVLINHEFRGEFNTTDATLIDDITEWLNGEEDFYFGDSREELELYVLKLAGVGETEEINDAMYCHWQSISEEMFEEACERMDYLQSNMPDEV